MALAGSLTAPSSSARAMSCLLWRQHMQPSLRLQHVGQLIMLRTRLLVERLSCAVGLLGWRYATCMLQYLCLVARHYRACAVVGLHDVHRLMMPAEMCRWSPAAAIASLAIMAALLTTLVLAVTVKLVQRVRRSFRGGTGGGDGGSWRERLPFGRRSYAVRPPLAARQCTVADAHICESQRLCLWSATCAELQLTTILFSFYSISLTSRHGSRICKHLCTVAHGGHAYLRTACWLRPALCCPTC